MFISTTVRTILDTQRRAMHCLSQFSIVVQRSFEQTNQAIQTFQFMFCEKCGIIIVCLTCLHAHIDIEKWCELCEMRGDRYQASSFCHSVKQNDWISIAIEELRRERNFSDEIYANAGVRALMGWGRTVSGLCTLAAELCYFSVQSEMVSCENW